VAGAGVSAVDVSGTLCAQRVAELREAGELDATLRYHVRSDGEGRRSYHVEVRRGNKGQLRWVPTASDGTRWELWRGRHFVGRVWVNVGAAGDHWPGPPVEALWVRLESEHAARVVTVTRVDLRMAAEWLIDRVATGAEAAPR
jgi:hypothetical protein